MTVPEQWREKYGLRPHADAEWVPTKNGVLLRRIKQAARGQKVVESLEKGAVWKVRTDDLLRQTRSEA